jgi:predicted transcriptional regulator
MTVTLDIDKEDLPKVLSQLDKLEVKYHVNEDEDDDWGDLPEEAIEGIKAGLADIEAGRVHSHEEVMAHIHKRLDSLK